MSNSQRPDWPVAMTQKKAGVKMVDNMDSYTPSIETTLLILRMQVFHTELRFSAKAGDIFCSGTAILKIKYSCKTICESSKVVAADWPEADAILPPSVSAVH